MCTWSDGVDTHANLVQVARYGQRHGSNGAFTRRISRLAALTIKGRHTGRVDDDAPITVRIRLVLVHALRRLSDDVERPTYIYLQCVVKF